jgi:acetolactate synthase-1/2/3 large subunit
VILCRSEHATVYAADGYARASGKPGYVYGQYDPGVANVVAGLADPYWASSPVISLNNAMRTSAIGCYDYQELDQASHAHLGHGPGSVPPYSEWTTQVTARVREWRLRASALAESDTSKPEAVWAPVTNFEGIVPRDV